MTDTSADGQVTDAVHLNDNKDGSYSAYFVPRQTGNFQMECKASGNENTVIVAPRKKRSVPEEKTGIFLREVTGAGIKVNQSYEFMFKN